ncbi:MAG: type II toxin-antitoxin system HipA family toxin [Bacteroidales bacterium]|nr:type II toxin-antitoxin system HipA family toxin [Bacteroidales bacterium]
MTTKNITVKVHLWGTCIGTLSWSFDKHCAVFQFSEEYKHQAYDICPSTHPKSRPLTAAFYGNRADPYQGLPEFLADALPDKWGSSLFNQWITDHNIQISEALPLLKLTYIGKRAMGALEFFPEMEQGDIEDSVNMASLAALSSKIYTNRLAAAISPEESLTMKKLIYLGTSAGGMRPKAVIAYNHETGEFRSGQTATPEGFKQYIIKFKESDDAPTTEIEMVYYEMAKKAGICMMPSSLVNIDGKNHFITERFDRKNGEKIFSQTLAAIMPGADDYMKLCWIADTLHLPQEDKDQIFIRMVFNFVAGVTDDHHKNISFLMDKNGTWRLSPAYDVTFTANTWEDLSAHIHSMGVTGKRSALTTSDFMNFAEDFVADPEDKIRKVLNAVDEFLPLCKAYGIETSIAQKINQVISTLVTNDLNI